MVVLAHADGSMCATGLEIRIDFIIINEFYSSYGK